MPIPREIQLARLRPLPDVGQTGGKDGLGPEVANRVIAVAGLDGEGADNVCLEVRFWSSLGDNARFLLSGIQMEPMVSQGMTRQSFTFS
jgi:hypothetical protein